MRTTALGAARRRSVAFRWRKPPRRRWIGLALLAVLVAACGRPLYRWWTSWPARAVLPAPWVTWPSTFSPDGTIFVTSGFDGITFWNTADGSKRASWALPQPNKRLAFGGTFSPDGRTFAATRDGAPSQIPTIIVIEVATGHAVAMISAGKNVVLGKGGTSAGSFSADSGKLRFPLGRQGAIDILECDVATGRVSTLASVAGSGTIRYLRHASIARGEKMRLLVGYDGTAEVIDCEVATGHIASGHRFAARWDWLFSPLVLSADARHLAVSPCVPSPRWIHARDVFIWYLEQGREVGRLAGRAGQPGVCALDCNADWTVLALAREDGSIETWDPQTRRLRATFRGHSPGFAPFRNFRIAPDGSTLASVGNWQRVAFTATSLSWYLPQRASRLLGVPARGLGWDPPVDTLVLDLRSGRYLGQTMQEGLPVYAEDSRTLATTDGTHIKLRDIPGRR